MYRKDAGNGLWCCFLLPLACAQNLSHHNYNNLLLGLGLISASLLAAYELLFMDFNRVFKCVISDLFERAGSAKVRLDRNQDQNCKNNSNPLLCKVVFNVAFVISAYYWDRNWISTCGLVIVYQRTLPRFFNLYKGSFTFGEGCIALQVSVPFRLEMGTNGCPDFLTDCNQRTQN